MLTIRLSRIGKRKKPMYRLIISEKAKDPYGRSLEILGSYNPFTKELQVKKDRIEHWLGQGSGISPTVNNLLVEKGVIKGEKIKASVAKKKKKEKDEDKKEPASGSDNSGSQKDEEQTPAESAESEEKPKEEQSKTDDSAGEDNK